MKEEEDEEEEKSRRRKRIRINNNNNWKKRPSLAAGSEELNSQLRGWCKARRQAKL